MSEERSSLNDGDKGFCFGMVFGLIIGLSVGTICGGKLSDLDWRKHAVEHSAAEWQINPKTGKKQFVWRNKTSQPE